MRYPALIFALFPQAPWAQGESSAGAGPLEPVSSLYLIKLTGGLVAIVAIIFLLAWAVRKFNLNQQAGSGLLRIVAGIPIGTRDRIVLLQVGEEQILLGLSPGRIEKLHTLAQPLASAQAEPAPGAFASRLDRLMNDRESS